MTIKWGLIGASTIAREWVIGAIRATGGKQLAGKDLMRFRINKDRVLAMMQKAPSAAQVAQANQ